MRLAQGELKIKHVFFLPDNQCGVMAACLIPQRIGQLVFDIGRKGIRIIDKTDNLCAQIKIFDENRDAQTFRVVAKGVQQAVPLCARQVANMHWFLSGKHI